MGIKEKTACITGHRNISNCDLPMLTNLLDKTIEELVGKGVIFYGCGMARGFDLLAARAVLKAREKNKDVALISVLPCIGQDSRWNESDKQEYKRILEMANNVVYVSEKPYYDGCMEARNRHLVNHSSVCIAYMKHLQSGSSQTVRLAKEQGLQVINLAEK